VPGPDHAYSYAVLRAVPSAERGEQVNVGVVLYCRTLDFLGLRWHVDDARLTALDPSLDVAAVRGHLGWLEQVCAGTASGSVAAMDEQGRFGWIVAPASTVVQPGPVHTGLCPDPAAALDHLFARLVS
jgi:hypothetical protein